MPLNYVCMHVSVCVCLHTWVQRRSEGTSDAVGLDLQVPGWELPDVGAGNRTPVFAGNAVLFSITPLTLSSPPLLKVNFLKDVFTLFYVCECPPCMCTWVLCVCLVPVEVRKDIWSPVTDGWVLGTELGSSIKAASGLDVWAISSAPA